MGSASPILLGKVGLCVSPSNLAQWGTQAEWSEVCTAHDLVSPSTTMLARVSASGTDLRVCRSTGQLAKM